MSMWWNEIDVEVSLCKLDIGEAEVAGSLAEAWALLPESGEGWVALADAVGLYDPEQRKGWLQHAEVASGATTVVLHQAVEAWRAWRWTEEAGQTHRRVTWRYHSSLVSAGGRERFMRYYTYWTQSPDDDIGVWQPVGSRFAGWED